jgi:hypothetical protein
VFILIVAGAGAMEAMKPQPKVSIRCTARLDTGHCEVENTGGKIGDVDAQVVMVCRDGEHTAHLSARVEPHSHVTKIIEGFEPSVGILSSCAGIDYRSVYVR